MGIRFTWDPQKANANVRKHRVDFKTASEIFDDPFLIVMEDRADQDGELRFQALGRARNDLLLLVIYVDRNEDGWDIVRILSARKAVAYEKSTYTDQF